jgi:hypothetical protein
MSGTSEGEIDMSRSRMKMSLREVSTMWARVFRKSVTKTN